MRTLSKAIIAAFILGGSVFAASAADVMTAITATDPPEGTFDSGVINGHIAIMTGLSAAAIPPR